MKSKLADLPGFVLQCLQMPRQGWISHCGVLLFQERNARYDNISELKKTCLETIFLDTRIESFWHHCETGIISIGQTAGTRRVLVCLVELVSSVFHKWQHRWCSSSFSSHWNSFRSFAYNERALSSMGWQCIWDSVVVFVIHRYLICLWISYPNYGGLKKP